MQKSIQALKYLAYLGIFIIPFLALVVSGTMFFPFITGKNFLFRIIIEITVALWAIVAIFEPRYRPKKTWIFLTLVFFTLGMALSSVFGANFYRSFWSNYERMEGLITFLHLFAYFTVLISFLKTEKAWDWLLKTNLGVNVFYSSLAGLKLTKGIAWMLLWAMLLIWPFIWLSVFLPPCCSLLGVKTKEVPFGFMLPLLLCKLLFYITQPPEEPSWV